MKKDQFSKRAERAFDINSEDEIKGRIKSVVTEALKRSLVDEKMTIEFNGHDTQIGSVTHRTVDQLIDYVIKAIDEA